MLFELLLVLFGFPAGYWGVAYVRARPFGSATFGWMLLGTAVLALLSVAARWTGEDLDWLGAIAIGAGACLLVVGPAVRKAARWAVATDRFRLAAVLIEIRDLLQPGTGAAEEKVLLGSLRAVRAGQVDDAVASLRDIRVRAPRSARQHIDERIAMLYLSAQRYPDAIEHLERTVLPRRDRAADDEPGLTDDQLPLIELPDPEKERALRDLGISPTLYPEVVGAYARQGDFDRAAELATAIDGQVRNLPELVFVVHRVRLVFLALCGRIDAVERLLAPAGAAYMLPSARLYWRGVARERSGDRAGALADYRAALAKAKRDPRVRTIVADAIANIESSTRAELPPYAARTADRLSASELAIPAVTRRRVAGTVGLVAINAVVAVATLLLGPAGDLGTVVRAGAGVDSAITAGEWWRIASGVVVHVGWTHLLMNVLWLWLVGRLLETMAGSLRLAVVYGLAGLAGGVASFAAGTLGISTGSSAAMMGLVGAVIAELMLRRRGPFRPQGRRLAVVLGIGIVAQAAFGFAFQVIDQVAHLAGFLVGAGVTWLVSPFRTRSRLVDGGVAVAAALLAALLVGAALKVAMTPLAATLAATPQSRRVLGEVTVMTPRSWQQVGDELVDPELSVLLAVGRESPDDEQGWKRWRERELARAGERGLRSFQPVTSRLQLGGWRHEELLGAFEDALGNTQRYRLVLFGHSGGAVPVVGSLLAPDLLVRDAAGYFAAIATSVTPR